MASSPVATSADQDSTRSRIGEWIRLFELVKAILGSATFVLMAATLLWIAVFGTGAQICTTRIFFVEKLDALPLPYKSEIKGFVEALMSDCKATIGDETTIAALRILQDPAARRQFSPVMRPKDSIIAATDGAFGPALPGGETVAKPGSNVQSTPPSRESQAKSPTSSNEAAPLSPEGNGWVSVGFVDDDTSFILPNGKVVENLTTGDRIVAKQPVNLRKKAADWTTPLAVLSTGQKATLVEPPKILKAGSLRQVWAHVRLD